MRTVIPIKRVDKDEFGMEADGWERRGVLGEPRLSEMAQNYRELGYEVEVIEVQRREGDCTVCFDEGEAAGQVYGLLFIRRKTDADQGQ